MAFPCTANSDSISVGSSGGDPQWTVNIAPTQSCAGGTATSPNSLSIIGGQGLYVPATKVWSVGDGGAALPFFYENPSDGYERWPGGFAGAPLSTASPDLLCYTMKTVHYQFYNPTCHLMKVQVTCIGQLNVKRPQDVDAEAGMLTSFALPANFATGFTPGSTIPIAPVGGLELAKLVGGTSLTTTPTFVDAPSLVIGPGVTINYYVELFFGASNWNGHGGVFITCDFWQLKLNAIGVSDVV